MRMNVFYVFGAMAISMPLFLVSCSSADDAVETPHPTSSDTVKTSFTLSVGLPKSNTSGAKAMSRVSDATAQAQSSPVFRGMDNMTLIPFALASSTTTVGTDATRNGDNNIVLPNTTPNTLSSDQITSTGNAKVYVDVSIPTETNAFLFYAKAIDATAGTSASTANDMFKYGTLKAAGLDAGKPSGISFTPVPITTSPDMTKGEAIATYLTSIANAKGWSSVSVDASTGQGKGLKNLYDNFIKLSAGSSDAIQNAVQDLYTSVVDLKSSQTTANQTICDAITTAIKNSTYASLNSDDKTLKFTDAISGYPANLNLPDGAATVKWADSKFTAQSTPTYTTDGTNVSAMKDYVYPISLWYRANTQIATSDADLKDKYVNGTSWADILNNYTSNPGTVTSSTHSIALKDQIQYAVGRLDTKVKLAGETLYDNNGAAVTLQGDGFPVTAILVGGQRAVNYLFQSASSDNTQYTVYDKDLNTTTTDNTTTKMIASKDGSITNHTLLLETPEKTPIYMVVELQNNTGRAFRGYNNGVIPAGSKFYLVAKLDPDADTGVTQPSTTTGFDKEKVIQQDFTTVANLTIGASSTSGGNTGLGAAYNVIPDLRTPALSIGMSVDLTWQNGLTFNVTM